MKNNRKQPLIAKKKQLEQASASIDMNIKSI